MSIGEVIRESRKNAGLSLRQLAAQVDVDPAHISRVERGLTPISQNLLGRISAALGLSDESLSLLSGHVPASWKNVVAQAPEQSAMAMRSALGLQDPRLRATSQKVTVSFHGSRAIEDDAFPFEWLSQLAEIESWRKEIHRPVYHLHKWWAQRLGSVFRAILISSFAPGGSDVRRMFHEPVRVPGAVVLDPFMGSGTTVGEAVKLGMSPIGRDINRVAYFGVCNALRIATVDDVRGIFRSVMSDIAPQVEQYYATSLAGGETVPVAYYFWVKVAPCPACSSEVDLFNSYVFSRHAYPKRHPTARILCPSCGAVGVGRYDDVTFTCTQCDCTFDPRGGPARRTRATCPDCQHSFRILDSVRTSDAPPRERLYAKMIIPISGERIYLAATEDDHERYAAAERRLRGFDGLFPICQIESGYNTKQILNYGYRRWDQLFNARQLLSLGLLGQRIAAIEESTSRQLFICLFSGLLEFHNRFTSFKGEGTGAVRHMFSHHILKPERTPLEANPFSAKGSGSFPGLFKRRLLRARAYALAPTEIAVAPDSASKKSKHISGLSDPLSIPIRDSYGEFRSKGGIYLSCGDSSSTDIDAESVDAIVTDPPFFDNVHYSELADFFYVWQRHLLGKTDPTSEPTTRSDREVQHGDQDEFSARLASVWRECNRVLTRDGLLVFTYHHSRHEGWTAVLASLALSDFGVTAAHPVKSEMSVATPKAQAKSPIDIDVIFVCRKRLGTTQEGPSTDSRLLEQAAETARAQIARFNETGRIMSCNDVRVLVSAQLVRLLSWEVDIARSKSRLESIASELALTSDQLFDEQSLGEAVGHHPQLSIL